MSKPMVDSRTYLRSGKLGRWQIQHDINTGSFGHVVLGTDGKVSDLTSPINNHEALV